jgi:phage baseplate assembly protein W|tara:strand:- start:4320 stop:4727 length:408 start_codon:yes stop_codon:yes gene_type:complete
MKDNIDFLGKGWSFPVKFNKTLNVLETTTGNKDIVSSLEILLGTIPGERHFHPDFGCDLSFIAFEKLNLSLETMITHVIKTAILKFEPRINLEKIKFEQEIESGIVFIHIFYEIKSTNSRTNMVFPYYLNEGTDL